MEEMEEMDDGGCRVWCAVVWPLALAAEGG
jgi:hypothetical protein